jgi:hypothetical protein
MTDALKRRPSIRQLTVTRAAQVPGSLRRKLLTRVTGHLQMALGEAPSPSGVKSFIQNPDRTAIGCIPQRPGAALGNARQLSGLFYVFEEDPSFEAATSCPLVGGERK